MPTDRRAPGRDRRSPSKSSKSKESKAKAKAKEKAEAAEVKPRKRERRMGDRRESPRLPIKVWVRNAAATDFEEVEGDISVGGMHFTDVRPIQGKKIDLRFKLPNRDAEVRVQGDVVEVSSKGNRYGAHVRFTDLDVETELAIARYIDERSA
jgi:hypothetical protein